MAMPLSADDAAAGVGFPVDIALLDSDRQVLANGITTVFHSVTCLVGTGPWRGPENARAIIAAAGVICARCSAPTAVSSAHESSNSMPEAEVLGWLTTPNRRAGVQRSHDIGRRIEKSRCKYSPHVERSGVSHAQFEEADDRVHRARARFPARSSALRRRRAQPACRAVA